MNTRLNFYRFLNVILLVIIFSLGRVMFVSAHGGDGTLIHACVNNRSGAVRIVSANTACDASKETALDWGVQGPQGDKGDTGDVGPTGPQGEPGPAGVSCDLEWRIKYAVPEFAISQTCAIDSDVDGLADAEENIHGTNPLISDTDGDGLFDGVEIKHPNICFTSGGPLNPLMSDTDGDTLTDADECFLYLTFPGDSDSDDDGIIDSNEDIYNVWDDDNDGLAFDAEWWFMTDANNPDTDGDGFSDRVEAGAGTAPTDQGSHP